MERLCRSMPHRGLTVFEGIVGDSDALIDVLAEVKMIAPETGAGKEQPRPGSVPKRGELRSHSGRSAGE